MSDLFDLPFEEEDDSREPVNAPARSTVGDDASIPATPIAARRILTVTELTIRLRDVLENEFFEVWVEGELSNCRVWNTGHLYFTLKDAATQIRGVILDRKSVV